MRIGLVAVDSQFIHSNLALRYLHTLAENMDCQSELIETTVNDDVDGSLALLCNKCPDLVVFSCYIWNIRWIEELVSALKILRPDVLVACGGPEVAWCAEEFLNRCPADLVLAGEVETVFPPLLEGLAKNLHSGNSLWEVLNGCPGLYLRTPEGVCFTRNAPLADMAQVPFPYDRRSLDELCHRIVYYEGQRGCPFGCSYCLSSIDRKLRHKPVDMVKRELKVFLEERVPLVKFTDRTFNAREEWAFAILDFLAEETRIHSWTTSFHFEIGAAGLSPRLVRLFQEAPRRLFQIEAGIQTTDPEVLRLIRRKDDPIRLRENLQAILSAGRVHVHTDLIAGLPGDTLESFRRSFNECIAMDPDMLQVGFLKVLKGTPLFEDRERWGIRYRPWPPYEVLATDTMSWPDLQKIKKIEQVTDKYFNSGNFRTSIRFLLSLSSEPWILFYNIGEILSGRQKGRKSLPAEGYYSVILELSRALTPENSRILSDLARFDWILTNRSGAVPQQLSEEKYNSERGRLRHRNDDISRTIPNSHEKSLLKGNVCGFNIDVIRFWKTGEIIPEKTTVFYSPLLGDPIRVAQGSDGIYQGI